MTWPDICEQYPEAPENKKIEPIKADTVDNLASNFENLGTNLSLLLGKLESISDIDIFGALVPRMTKQGQHFFEVKPDEEKIAEIQKIIEVFMKDNNSINLFVGWMKALPENVKQKLVILMKRMDEVPSSVIKELSI